MAFCGCECLVKTDLFADQPVFKTVGHFDILPDEGIPVAMGQKAGFAGRLGKFPLGKPHDKAGFHIIQSHAACRCEDHSIQRFGNVAQIRRAQQNREHFAVFVRRDLILPQQQPDLVQQIDHDIPFAEHFFGSGNALLVPQPGRQIVYGSLRPQIFQKEINALGNAHGRFAAAGLDKFFHGRDQLLTRLLRQS